MKYLYASAMIAVILCMTSFLTACGGAPKGEAVLPKDGVFSFNAREIGAGDVRFYRYDGGRKRVTFFIARTPSGEIRTAFDACVTCYPYKMGYKVGNGCVVCVYCNTAFKLDELGTGKGNCIPIAIPHHIEGDTLTINQKDIEAGERWF
jgi:uncharacterized membrane protein